MPFFAVFAALFLGLSFIASQSFAQERFFTQSTSRGLQNAKLEAQLATAESNISANSTSITAVTTRINSAETTAASCTNAEEKLVWNSGAWDCRTEDDPTVQSWAKSSVGNCSSGQVLSMSGGALTCTSISGSSYETDPFVQEFARTDNAISACSSGELLTAYTSGSDVLIQCTTVGSYVEGAEVDPNVEDFAKTTLPTCGVGEVLKGNGTSLSCVDDIGGTGSAISLESLSNVDTSGKDTDSFLKWNGTAWADADEADPTVMAFAQATLPTCGADEVLSGDGTDLSCVDAATAALGGISLSGLSDVTLTTPSSNQVLAYNGSGWVNATETDPLVSSWAKSANQISDCSSGEVLNMASGVLACTSAATAVGSNLDIGDLGDVTISSASNNEVLTYSGGSWVNSSISETDPLVANFAKTTLPTCSSGSVLTGNGTALSCTDVATEIGSSLNLDDLGDVTATDSNGNFLVGTGSGFVMESGATARASLGLTIGTDVQAYDAQLADVAGLTPTDGNFIVGDGTNFVAESGSTARTSLGLAIGSDVQAYDSDLTTFADNPLTSAELGQLQNINTSTISAAQWGYLGATNQGLATTDDVTFNSLTVSGGISADSIAWTGITSVPTPVTAISNSALTSAEIGELENIDATTISGTQWGYLGALDQGLTSSSNVTFNQITGSLQTAAQTNITSVGTLTGLNVSGSASLSDVVASGLEVSGTTYTDALYVNGTQITGSASAINDLSDVNTSGVATNDILAWNGSSWVVSQTTVASNYDASNVAITGGSISGITDLAVADGGTGASDASTARTNLGVAIGSDVQAYDAQLADVAGLTPTDGNVIVGDGTNFVAESGATARASLGLGSSDDVTFNTVTGTLSTAAQTNITSVGTLTGLNTTGHISGTTISATYITGDGSGLTGVVADSVSMGLNDLNDVTATDTDGNILVGTGAGFVMESGATARTSLGLAIGSDVQAYDADLTTFADNPLTSAELGQLQNINANTITDTQWSYLGTADQALATTSDVTFNSITVSGGISADSIAWTGITSVPTPVAAVSNSALTSAEIGELENIDSTTISGTQWGYLGALDQGLTSSSNVTFNQITGNLQTAAQTNITSLGTLTGLNVSGSASLSDVAASGLEVSGTTYTDALVVNGTAITGGASALNELSDVTATDADGNFLVGTGSGFVMESGATVRTSLGLTIGTNVQAYDAQLADIAGLSPSENDIIAWNGSSWVVSQTTVASNYDASNVAITGGSISGITDLAVADGGTGASDASTARTNLGVAIGSDVQAYDAQLADVAGLTPTDGNIIVGDGANFVAESGSTARTSLGLGSSDDVTFANISATAISGDGSQLTGITASGVDWTGITNVPTGVSNISGTALTTAELGELQNIDATTISGTQWGYLGATNQGLATTDDVTFNTVTGTLSTAAQTNITSLGTLTELSVSGSTSLTDVSATTLQVSGTTYTDALYVNGTAITGSASAINDLSDVNTSGVATNDILAWNGSSWVVSQTTVAGTDNLGDHTATQALDMGGFNIVNAATVSATSVQVSGTAYLQTINVEKSRAQPCQPQTRIPSHLVAMTTSVTTLRQQT
jgi:hypothetical protein